MRAADPHTLSTSLQVPLLAALNASQRSELCTALKPRIFNAGEMIVRKGEPGEAFYIVESGSCLVLGDSGQACKPSLLLNHNSHSHKATFITYDHSKHGFALGLTAKATMKVSQHTLSVR